MQLFPCQPFLPLTAKLYSDNSTSASYYSTVPPAPRATARSLTLSGAGITALHHKAVQIKGSYSAVPKDLLDNLSYYKCFINDKMLKMTKNFISMQPFTFQGKNRPTIQLYGDQKYIYNSYTRNLSPTSLDEATVLKKVLHGVNAALNTNFNSILVNRYSSPDVYLPWHKDNEKKLDKTAPIVTLSLGAERSFQFSINQNHPILDVTLEDNSLMVMEPWTQVKYYHQLAKGNPNLTTQWGERYSLTFRRLVPYSSSLLPVTRFYKSRVQNSAASKEVLTMDKCLPPRAPVLPVTQYPGSQALPIAQPQIGHVVKVKPQSVAQSETEPVAQPAPDTTSSNLVPASPDLPPASIDPSSPGTIPVLPASHHASYDYHPASSQPADPSLDCDPLIPEPHPDSSDPVSNSYQPTPASSNPHFNSSRRLSASLYFDPASAKHPHVVHCTRLLHSTPTLDTLRATVLIGGGHKRNNLILDQADDDGDDLGSDDSDMVSGSDVSNLIDDSSQLHGEEFTPFFDFNDPLWQHTIEHSTHNTTRPEKKQKDADRKREFPMLINSAGSEKGGKKAAMVSESRKNDNPEKK